MVDPKTKVSFVERLGRWVEGPAVQRFIVALIILNGISLGLETAPGLVGSFWPALHAFDIFVLSVFSLEIGAKLAYRRGAFFRNGWNVFDFIIVAIALIPAAGPFSVLRALRILRVLRLVSAVPAMRRVVSALLAAVPGLLSVGSIIALCFYVGAVLSTKLFGTSFPEWFGSIGESMYTLFQVMTLESWSMGIVRPVMEQYPFAWLFFVPFIVAMSFAILNLFIGIIVDAMQTVHEHERQEALAQAEADGTAPVSPQDQELAHIRAELAEIKELLKNNR